MFNIVIIIVLLLMSVRIYFLHFGAAMMDANILIVQHILIIIDFFGYIMLLLSLVTFWAMSLF